MKNNLFFILIFCGLIFSKNYSYYLSKANNAFDQDDLDQAIFYYNEALSINKFGADAYLQLGYIHNSRKLSKTALQYFKLAEKNKSYFLYPERSVELYLNMAAAYNRLEQKNTEKIYLEKIVQETQEKKTKIYLSYRGKALFALALSAQNKKQYRIAVEYFKQCILVNFNLKQCYLYICGYYGENPQEKINKYNLEAGFKEFEDRNFFFNYYYAKYQQIKEEDFFIVNLSSYQKLKNRVEQIKKEME